MYSNYKKRTQLFQKIKPYIGNSLIKVLVGQRRVGKSHLLFQIKDEIIALDHTIEFVYINKEDLEFDHIRNYADLVGYVEKKHTVSKKTILLIDEIQEIEQFEKALRHFQTSNKYDIYCTGSNATLLSGELATLLAGRYIKIEVHALSYLEFLDFHNLENTQENLLEYIKFGGMPHLINLKKEQSVYSEYHKNILSTIVLKDIITRYKIRNISFLNDLIRFLADNIGSIISAKKISDYLKSQKINIQPKSVLEYLTYIENVMFVHRVRRSEIVGKKIFEIGDKFYFEDLGMRNAIIPFNIKDMGKVLENLVYNHLRILGYQIYVGKLGDKEIDFIAQMSDKKFYIQVTYLIQNNATHEREFGNLLKINDNYKKMVVSMDDFATGDYQGVEHLHIRKFLSEFI